MPVRIVEGQLPYTGGTGIEIDANKVISLLLREENNLILVNDDNEIYTDLQLASGLTPQSDFPVGVTTGKVLEADGRPQSGLMLNWKTTSGDYARWIYANDGKIYFDNGTGIWKQVYYSSEVDILLQQLRNYVDLNFQPKLTAGTGIAIDSNNVISNSLPGAIVSATTPSNPTEGMVWYDTTNDVLKTYDGTNWNEVGSGTADVNTKTFFPSSLQDLETGQAIIDYLQSGKHPIIKYNNTTYYLRNFEYGDNLPEHYTFTSTLRPVSPTQNRDDCYRIFQIECTANTTTVVKMTEGNTNLSQTYLHLGNQWYGLAQTVYGTKTFNTSPVVPSKSTSAGNNPTTIATEAQVYLKQDKLTAGTNIQISNNVISATGGSDIVYATQAEYNALLPGAESDGKHYFIYSTSGGGGWQPGVNTIAYYPLDTDFNDASGNSRNLINSGATITSLGGVACGYWNGSATAYYQGYSITRDERTISARVNGHMIDDNVCVQIAKKDVALRGSLTTVFYGGNILIADNYSSGTTGYAATADTRYYVVGTQEGNTVKFYINGNLYDTVTTRPVYQSAPDGWSLGSQDNSGAGAKLNGYMSNVILEDKVRTAQEVLDYFDLTKADYGIS